MKHGFSLVELSIVLVILGLLTGGILAGQNLIRAAELRAVTSEYDRIIAAVNTFRDKYFALPGDMRNAEDFWGTMTNCGAGSPSVTGTQTCNGDGDGAIDSGSASQTGEYFTLWQQLANAGLIEGSYTGIAGAGGGAHAVLGENAPRGKISNAGWSMWYAPNYGGNPELWAYDYQNAMFFGGQNPTNVSYSPILSTTETWNLDTKMDDGKPGSGKLLGLRNGCTNSTSVTDFGADYVLNSDGNICRIVFPKVF